VKQQAAAAWVVVTEGWVSTSTSSPINNIVIMLIGGVGTKYCKISHKILAHELLLNTRRQ